MGISLELVTYIGTIFKKYFRLLVYFVLGPNEVSICNLETVIPLMGPYGLEKGPCKFYQLGFIFIYFYIHSHSLL